jgi:hypothetical protein
MGFVVALFPASAIHCHDSHFPPRAESMDWHRAFGLILSDLFTASPYSVDTELDVSTTRQLLDVVVVRRRGGDFVGELPDGFAPLADHNLLTFKSHQETLDLWAVQELIGHYVNYRKCVSPSWEKLIATESIRLFGVTARFPTQFAQEVELRKVQDGVYDIISRLAPVRLIVIRDLPQTQANSGLELLSAAQKQLEFATANFRQKNPETSSFIQELIDSYREGGIVVPDPMEAYKREVRAKWLAELSVQERLEGLSPEERLKGLPPEERLKGLTKEEVDALLQKFREEQNDPKNP